MELRDSELYELHFREKERRSNARFAIAIFLVFIMLLFFRIWWTGSFGGVIVDGNSMNVTLYDGEKLLMRYVGDDVQAKRGDIIVVHVGKYKEQYSSVTGEYLIKRLIAIEGDKVRCTDGKLEICYAGTVEWKILDEPYAYYGVNDRYKTSYDFKDVYEVGKGEIFFLGDNRSGPGTSVDSRFQENDKMSHLDKLYKVEDIYGIVPSWALENHKILEKIFF